MLSILINTGNAAFQDDPRELSRVVREAADRIDEGQTSGILRDSNGNKVGEFGTRKSALTALAPEMYRLLKTSYEADDPGDYDLSAFLADVQYIIRKVEGKD